MNKNTKTSYHIRKKIINDYLSGASVAQLSEQFDISKSWIYRLIRNYQNHGESVFNIGHSRPHHSPRALCSGLQQAIKALVLGGWSQYRVAETLKISESVVSKTLSKLLGNRWRKLAVRPIRYEYEQPGEMVHIDIKRVSQFDSPGWRVTRDRLNTPKSKGSGYAYVHVCVDDHSRYAMAEQMSDQTGMSATIFMKKVIQHYHDNGKKIERVMTDNGPCYYSKPFNQLLEKHGIKHIYTKPYTPQTNGKAERFIKTLMNEWGYGKTYQSSFERKQKLPCYLNWYNQFRKHGSLMKKPPVSRFKVNNVCEAYT